MEETRRNLELCINEFFAPGTSNERKRQIEGLLENFSQQNGAWKQALYCLSTIGDNCHTMMYCLSVIENTIKCRWMLMMEQEQTEIKSTIYAFLLQHSSSSSQARCPYFVRNKIIKLLTDIGKVAWPHQHPDFFNNVLQISQSSDTVILGLIFLKTISEEWTNLKDEVSTERKMTLKALLTKEVPNIFRVFQNLLLASMKHRETATSPSTEHSPASDGAIALNYDEIIFLTLETATHFASWISLDGSNPNPPAPQGSHAVRDETKCAPFGVDFIQVLCQYALFDTCPASSHTGITHSVRALGALNELLYRKFVPKEFDDQVNFIVRFAVELLNKMLSRTTESALPEEYLEKVIEFLCLITSSHFHRYDEESAKAFMSLLLPFTFRRQETIHYYECLEIWARLLDYFIAQQQVVLDSYAQPILGLANGIVMSTAKYQVVVEDYFEQEDDEVEAPSITRNIDILVKIGELLPVESLESLKSAWAESCRFFDNLHTSIGPTPKTVIQISNTTEIEHFNFIVQLMGRMANIFYGDVFKKEVDLGKTLFQQLVGIYNFSRKFYFVKDPEVILKASCEIVFALRTWTYWLSRFHSEIILAESTLEDQQMFFELLGVITEVVFFAIENHAQIDPSIVIANVNFFTTLVNSIRTQYVFQIASVQTLVQKILLLKGTLKPEVFRILNKSVAIILLLPWQSVSQQEWETRTQLYNNYMKSLLEELGRTSSDPQCVIYYLQILNDQLDCLMMENANSKKICWNVLKQVVPFLQKLSTTYLRQPNVSEQILNFFSKIMEVLRQQAGAPFFEESIRGFLALFASENIINDLMRETESSSIVVEKFLQLLQFMVKDPSPSFKKFLDDALSICYDHVYPILAQRSSPDLKIPFFSLIRDTLNYRWNYFFPTLVLHQQNLMSDPTQQQQDLVSGKRLDQILQSIGHSFLQPDLEVFRYNLESLTSWNEKHNLYTKLASHGKIISQFMTVLLQVLVHKSHDLHREEVARVLHEMSSTDFPQFRKSFLYEFLQSSFPALAPEHVAVLIQKFGSTGGESQPGVNNENCSSIDLHTFSLLLSQFIEDLRYFHFTIECQKLSPSSQAIGSGDGKPSPSQAMGTGGDGKSP